MFYGLVGGRCAFTYIYLADMVPLNSIPIVGTLYFVIDGLTLGLQSVYFMWISKHYQYYMLLLIFASLTIFLLAFCFLVDSPMRLLQSG